MTLPMTMSSVTTTELAALLAGETPVTLVDVRERHEWNAGHLPGAVHLPMSELVQRHEELRSLDGPVHIVCQSGSRSARCTEFLAQNGHPAVNVLGGTGAWQRGGGELSFSA